MRKVHLPTELEIIIEPAPNGSPGGGQAVLRAGTWVEVPQSALDLRIMPTRGDVHFNPVNGTYRVEITLAAQVQPPLDPPLVILP